MRLRLHSSGPFWTISTENQWEITEIGHLSCFSEFFVRFHIVCDRYTSDYAHFTFSDTIWPLLLSPNFGTQMITLAETASYSKMSDPLMFHDLWNNLTMIIWQLLDWSACLSWVCGTARRHILKSSNTESESNQIYLGYNFIHSKYQRVHQNILYFVKPHHPSTALTALSCYSFTFTILNSVL